MSLAHTEDVLARIFKSHFSLFISDIHQYQLGHLACVLGTYMVLSVLASWLLQAAVGKER